MEILEYHVVSDGAAEDVQFGGPDLISTLMALICAVIGGFCIVLAKPLIMQYGPVRMTAYTFAICFCVALEYVWTRSSKLREQRA